MIQNNDSKVSPWDVLMAILFCIDSKNRIAASDLTYNAVEISVGGAGNQHADSSVSGPRFS